jgi:stage II sporulation protein D
MSRYLNIIWIFLFIGPTILQGQVKVRLFSSYTPESVVFAVTGGEYEISGFRGGSEIFRKNDLIIISRYHGKLAVKSQHDKGYIVDSLKINAKTENSSFSLRLNGQNPVRQYYQGDFACYPDLGTLVLINKCDVESYIAGVVRAEGGTRKHIEYFKAQAIITRTYMYKHLDKHLHDKYSVCDNTHCQAFNGVSDDSVINSASLETHGLVILDRDSSLINSAFHSNCGGMTASSENVWVSGQTYFRSVTDPYCLNSRNAVWEKKISTAEWIEYLQKSGYAGKVNDPSVFSFYQNKRWVEYKAGTFTMPFETIREDMKLRSSFFSVIAARDSVLLKGKGYGHGVGLCQEGAMEMANRGSTYQQIIDFYYNEVIITDIKNAIYRMATGDRRQATGEQ